MSDENHGPSGAGAGCAGARELAGEPARRGHFLDAAHLDAWLRAHADDLARDIAALVRIPSVSAPPHARAEAGAGSCLPVAADTAGKDVPPFGRECARVVDATRGIVEGLGLVWRNHDYYAASALLASACAGDFDAVSASGVGAATDAPAARPRIAFFSHVDVVAAGDGWSHDPFDPYVRDGWLFGRGAADNKGAVVAVLYALAYVKEAGCRLDHDVVAYLGCDEERGMEDVRYLLRTEPPARVNLVSDAHWPVCVAEKGIVEGTMSVRLDDPALRSFEGGSAHNAVPDRVEARLTGSRLAHSLTFLGRGGHSAFPEGTDNAIVKAARALADEEHGALLSERTRTAFRALADAFQDVYGTGLGIAATDEVAGPITAVVSLARYEEGVLTATFNIRYAATADGAEVVRRVRAAAERAGFELGEVSVDPAHRAQGADELARDLTAIVNQVLGTDLAPYGLAGGTHARRIPGAVGFGPGRRDAQEPTVPAHGKGHEPDEAVSLASLLDAVRIYVRAILHLDAHPELAPAAGGFSLDGPAGVPHNSY